MHKWILPTLSEILAPEQGAAKDGLGHAVPGSLTQQRVKAEREWSGAIAALNAMLQQLTASTPEAADSTPQGLVLSAPLPVLDHPDLVQHFSSWYFTADLLAASVWLPFQLPPAAEACTSPACQANPALPLLPGDPLAAEQFCLVFTPHFSLVMVLGERQPEEPAFLFSFDPEPVHQAWQALRLRLSLMNPHALSQLDRLVEQFPVVAPDYRTVMQFTRLLLTHLPEPVDEPTVSRDGWGRQKLSDSEPFYQEASVTETATVGQESVDMELLQAIAHEVRTPLTTIRTLTRLLLKRPDLAPDVRKRLDLIDRECSAQIDRFGLIFRAVELKTSVVKKSAMPLTSTPLMELLQQSIPRWQQQASQRQLTLDVGLPSQMLTVVSDPTMLDQALTSLIERFTRNLPPGSHIQVDVTLAGDQLKLQLQANHRADSEEAEQGAAIPGMHNSSSPLKSIGQLLMFQPETGILSLNLEATKHLFQALGAKLIVRQKPQQGEVMTVFLPLEGTNPNILSC